MTSIGLIAMDMDGTLLNSRQELTAGNVAALKAAEAQGVKLAICSGRAPGDNALFALENGLEHCAILSLNGGYCLENPTEPPFANHVMDVETAQYSIKLLRELDISFGCFLQNRIGIFYGSRQKEPICWGSHGDGPLAPRIFHDWETLERLLPDGLNKLVAIEEQEPARLQAARQALAAQEKLDVTSSWAANLEIMPVGIGKGGAVRELAEKLGLKASQVMTLGDYDNDLSMIDYAGYGIAMGNASASVKAAAKYETLTNDEDGVAAAIKRFVLR